MKMKKLATLVALAALALGPGACSRQTPESLIAAAEVSVGNGDYRSAVIQLKSALEKDQDNPRARWLLGEVYLTAEDGPSAEKEIRRAGELGVVQDAVLPALAQALILQRKVDEVLALEVPSGFSPRATGELFAARGLAQLGKGDERAADELTAKGLATVPESSFAASARARVLLHTNQLDGAEAILQALQTSHPAYGFGWSLMGDLQDLKGDLPKAEEAYTAAAEKRPPGYQDLLKRGHVRLRQQKLDEALADADRLVKARPTLHSAWYLSGLVHFQKKEFAKAQEALDRAYQLDADHIQTLLVLSLADLMTGKADRAGQLARRAAAIAPNLVPARELLATVALRERKAAEAEEAVRPVVAAQPENLRAKGLLASSLLMQDKTEEAAQLLESIAAAKAESPEAQTRLGLALLRARQPEKGLDALGQAVELAPAAADANAALVSGLLSQEEFDDALTAAERFREKNPTDPVALRLVAFTYLARGDTERAKEGFRKVLEVAQGDAKASVALAHLLAGEGNTAEVRRILEEASAKNPDDTGLLVVLGVIASREGRAEDSKALWTRAIDKNPGNPTPRLLLGGQLLAENNPRRALEILPGEADSKDPRILAARADANLRLKEFSRARDDIERLVKLVPRAARVHFQLATAYAGLGDQARMDSALDKAAELAPNDAGIGLARARSLAVRGKVDEAAAQVGRLGLLETEPAVLTTKLLIAEKKGDNAERLRLAKALFEVQPSTQTVLGLMRAHSAAGKPESVEQILRDWLGAHPSDDVVTLALAEVYARSGRQTEAASLLRPLVAKYPDNAVLLNNLAWYLKDASPAEALAMAEKAYAAAPDNPLVLDTYAAVLAQNGQFDKALRAIDRGIERSQESSSLRLQRIEILERAGDRATALRELDAITAEGLAGSLRDKAGALRARLAPGG
jgi:putative PEP-CTERM system TPR-repeat lipoprotein